jgi:hypothetical protein
MKKIFTLLVIVSLCTAARSQAWIELGSGPAALNANNTIWSLLADASGNIYAAGGFTDSTSAVDSAMYVVGNSYVAVWNGTTWSALGSLQANNAIYCMAQDAAGSIYAAGNFIDSNGRQYVAKWNGITWNELGIDTVGLNAVAPIYAVAVDQAGIVYAAGDFTDAVFAAGHRYVAAWNGQQWGELGPDSITGLNADSTILALATDKHGDLYAAGAFTDSSGYFYVAKWDGTAWTELGGTDSTGLFANGQINTLISDTAGNLYAGGTFTDSSGYYYIAKWNGAKWTELSNPATNQLSVLGPIKALTLDSVGNVYAGGMIPDSDGQFYYVIVWNGSQLIVANNNSSAPLDANAPIEAMTSDKYGNIYAAGNFNDAGLYQYVAEFTANIPAGITAVASDYLHIYPNPTSGIVFIQADHLSGSTDISVVDDLGRTLYTQSAEGATIQAHIDLSGFDTGIYTLLVRDSSDLTYTRRIVKE